MMMTQNPIDHADFLPSLRIDDREISWTEVFGCMQLFGKLKPFLRTFVSQYVLIEEINRRDDLTVESSDLMQAIMDLRVKKNLQDQDAFKNWLTSEHLDYATFQRKIILELMVEQLKEQIAAPDRNTYFEEHRDLFSELKFSCLVAQDKALAHQLRQAIVPDDLDFRQLATEYSASVETAVSYFQQQTQQRSLPSEIGEQLGSATIGDVIGPILVNEVWSIFRVEERIPAELNDEVKRYLDTKLFERWLAEKLTAMKVRLTQPEVSTGE